MKKTLLFAVLTLMAMMSTSAFAALPQPGIYKIKNVYSGTYVVLQHSQLADITADQENASVLYTWYTNKPNGEGLMTELSGDGGDMMETLDFIKGLIEELLEYNEKPTWFLEEMFQLHLVSTGDADGSVYLCVDVPEIENWEEIRDIILDAAGGQQAVTYYISHMHPGNRHYMGIDYDGSFGYRLEAGTPEGTDIKWIMENQMQDVINGYAYIKGLEGNAYAAMNLADAMKLNMTEAERTFNPGAVYRLNVSNEVVNQLRTQGVDAAEAIAAFVQSIASQMGEGMDANQCALTMRPTYTSEDKFSYPAYYLALSIPAVANEDAATQWETAKATALAALAAVLGNNHNISQILNEKADLLVPNTTVYFVPDGEDIDIISEADRMTYADAGKWMVEIIDNEQVYFAANPTEEFNGKYYTTLYTDFAYEIANPDKVKAYVITELNSQGEATSDQLVALGADIVPASTAVVLECSTQAATDNVLMPVVETSASGMPRRSPADDNLLQGVFFNEQQSVDADTRVLTIDNGLMTFAAPTGDYVDGNTAWLTAEPISTGIKDVKAATDTQNDVIYDLTGRRVMNPSHGIYILNGKKVVF